MPRTRLVALAVCKFCGQPVFREQLAARIPSEKNPDYTNVVHRACLDKHNNS